MKENAVPTIGLGSSAEHYYKTKRRKPYLFQEKNEKLTIYTEDDPLAKENDNHTIEYEENETSETVEEPDWLNMESNNRLNISQPKQVTVNLSSPISVASSSELYKLLSEKREWLLSEGFQLLRFPKVSLVKMLASEAKGLRIEASVEISHDLTYKVFYRNKEVAVPAAPTRIRFLSDANKIIEAFLKIINS